MNHDRLLLFARKPAPVQVTFGGYPGSTGVAAIDYRLSDPYLEPDGRDWDLGPEKVVRLPHTFWCYDPLTEEPGVNALPAAAAGHVTFGCLNNPIKINGEVLKVWARVLREVADSHILMHAAEGKHRAEMRAWFEKEGIGGERIEFASKSGRGAYLERFHRVDISLDPFPYNGHTSSLDSMWMGVPVVTLAGKTIVGRAGESQLMNIGMPEFMAREPGEYVSKAVALARDVGRLAELRRTLRERMRASPLMDAAGFARGVEGAYRDMWRRWCDS